jgi:uncharacterized protein (DUF305 family)
MKRYLIITIIIIAVGLFIYSVTRSKVITQTSDSMVHSFTVTDEKTFLENMIPHHMEAVETSRLILSQTKDHDLSQFTKGVIDSQSKEIEQMKTWIREWFNTEYSNNSNYEPMMGNLLDYLGTEQEKVYVEGMIRHHQGAIEMAKKALILNIRPETRLMAENIIKVQESEVKTLKDWLEKKYSDVQGEDKKMHNIQIH